MSFVAVVWHQESGTTLADAYFLAALQAAGFGAGVVAREERRLVALYGRDYLAAVRRRVDELARG